MLFCRSCRLLGHHATYILSSRLLPTRGDTAMPCIHSRGQNNLQPAGKSSWTLCTKNTAFQWAKDTMVSAKAVRPCPSIDRFTHAYLGVTLVQVWV